MNLLPVVAEQALVRLQYSLDISKLFLLEAEIIAQCDRSRRAVQVEDCLTPSREHVNVRWQVILSEYLDVVSVDAQDRWHKIST
jgi:hypothetical protein